MKKIIHRDLAQHIKKRASVAPAIAILGPRQSGKTTLAREIFKNHIYVSLENHDNRMFALQDPKAFLKKHRNEHGIIIDEFQRVPELLSYIQTYIDLEQPVGYFVLTGSQNFLMNASISQSLAGRVSINTLLPLSINELMQAKALPSEIEEAVFKGSYPRLYSTNEDPLDWYTDYELTYIDRDVREMVSIDDMSTFKKFVRLCAGRIGQLINYSSLAKDAGVDSTTAERWIEVLEAGYIIKLVKPHHRNFNKRLVKTPKLYFLDTGIACRLLGIESAGQVASHYLRGGLIESYIISDLFKQAYNLGRQPHIYFWRDSSGNEVDCLIERGDLLVPIEIKGNKTPSQFFFKDLTSWKKLADEFAGWPIVVYAGEETQKRSVGDLVAWQDIRDITQRIYDRPM